MINWPFEGEQKEKIERDQGGTVFKGTSMVVEKSAELESSSEDSLFQFCRGKP